MHYSQFCSAISDILRKNSDPGTQFIQKTLPFSVVVLGKFRRFLLVIFLSLFLHLDFSFIYSKFSMPFWGFFY